MREVPPVKIVSREEWEGHPPKDKPPFKGPVKYVVISYETPTTDCYSHEECLIAVKKLYHLYVIERNLADIPFNFLIGGDGSIFEARGFITEPCRSIPYYKQHHGNRLDIAYLGDYSGKPYPLVMLHSTEQVLSTAIHGNYVDRFYDPLDHRDVDKVVDTYLKEKEDRPWENWEIQEMARVLYGKTFSYEVAQDKMKHLIPKRNMPTNALCVVM